MGEWTGGNNLKPMGVEGVWKALVGEELLPIFQCRAHTENMQALVGSISSAARSSSSPSISYSLPSPPGLQGSERMENRGGERLMSRGPEGAEARAGSSPLL